MSQAHNPSRTVLVTRPAHQAGSLMTALSLRGYRAIAAPVLELHPSDVAIPSDDFDALAFTSANGVSAFAARDARRDIPVFAVGPATAAAARKAQFEQIVAGEAGAEEMAEIIRSRLPNGSHILYPSARDVAFDLQSALSAGGIRTTRVVVYDMEAAKALSPAALEAIGAGCTALVFSARTLSAFVALAVQAGVSLAKVKAIQFGAGPENGAAEGAAGILTVYGGVPGGDQAVIDFLEDVIARE